MNDESDCRSQQILDGKLICSVNPAVYSLEAVKGACHKLAGRAFASIQLDGDQGFISIEWRPRSSLENLEALANEFWMMVLDESLRIDLRKRTGPLRDLIIAQAYSRVNLTQPALDQTMPGEDPLNIGQPDPHTGRIHE